MFKSYNSLPADIASIIDEIIAFQDLRKDLTNTKRFRHSLDIDDAMTNMTKREFELKKEVVDKVHLYKISFGTKQKNGRAYEYYYTCTDAKGHQMTSRTEDGLYDKLFHFYFGDMDVFNMNSQKEMTLGELFTHWDDYRLNVIRRREKTVHRDRQVFNKDLKDLPIMKKKVVDITAKDLKRVFLSMAPTMTKKEFDKVKSILNGMFSFAVEELEIITVDVCTPIKANSQNGYEFIPPTSHITEVYTQSEREKILAYLESLPNQTGYTWGIRLMFCLDVRIGELKALKWTDYYPDKFDYPCIYISKQVIYDVDLNGKHTLKEIPNTKSKKKEGARLNPLTPRALTVLEEIQTANIDSPNNYILVTEAGTPIHTERFNIKLKEACEAVGVEYHSSHRLRNYSISEQAKASNDMCQIMYNSGHSDMETTLGYIRSASNRQNYEEWCEIHN